LPTVDGTHSGSAHHTKYLDSEAIAAVEGEATLVLGGVVSMTGQPAVAAHNSANEDNVTGDGTLVTVDFDTEIFDQNGDFASDTFTAPVTGKYLIQGTLRLSGITTAADSVVWRVVTSNRTWFYAWDALNNEPDLAHFSWSVLVDMDAADTVIIQVGVTGEASKVVDIVGSSSVLTFFCASLAY